MSAASSGHILPCVLYQSQFHGNSWNCSRKPCRALAASSTRTPSGMTSRPMPSPGITAIRYSVINLGVRKWKERNDGILARPVAGERDPVHQPAVAVVVVDRVVLRAAVVPERDRSRLPCKAAGELRPHLVAEKELEQRRALLVRHPLEPGGVRDIYIECFATGLRMRSHNRMLADVFARDRK